MVKPNTPLSDTQSHTPLHNQLGFLPLLRHRKGEEFCLVFCFLGQKQPKTSSLYKDAKLCCQPSHHQVLKAAEPLCCCWQRRGHLSLKRPISEEKSKTDASGRLNSSVDPWGFPCSAKFHEKMKRLQVFLWCAGDGWGCELFNTARRQRRSLSPRAFVPKVCKMPMVHNAQGKKLHCL